MMACAQTVDADGVAPVECRNLWKVFGDNPKTALELILRKGLDKDDARAELDCVIGVADVSLRIERGEILCIMGLSGSGKSTLLRHFNRLIQPTSGEVLINGRNIAELDRKAIEQLRSRTIGMVFQHMALWPHRTIRDNVGFGLEVRGVPRRERYGAVEDVLRMVKLDGWGERYPDELSGGMQQRVGLARALAADPDILLMDEPFSALDPLIRTELQDQFLELSKRLHKTTLFITHDLEEATRLGHRVAIMKGGEIVQIGSPADILLRPEGGYVNAFVEGIPRLKFMVAGDAMIGIESENGRAAGDAETPCLEIDRPLSDVIDLFAEGCGEVMVEQADGVVGRITPASLLSTVRKGME